VSASTVKARDVRVAATFLSAVLPIFLGGWFIMLAVGVLAPSMGLGYGGTLLVFLGVRGVSVAWRGLPAQTAKDDK
jgi:hypothetical protein